MANLFMMKFKIFNLFNLEVERLSIEKDINHLLNKRYVLSEVINWQRAKKRLGLQSAKTKSEVSGTTKKPFPQKGRGVARQGTLKNPHQYGGGVAFAPKPRNYAYVIPKSKKKIAIATAIFIRYREGSLRILDNFTPEIYKASFVNMLLKSFCKSGALIVDNKNYALKQCVGNLSKYRYIDVNHLNVYDILKYPFLIITKDSFVYLSKLYFC